MRRSNLSTLFYLLLVFMSGLVVGAFATRLYMVKTVGANPPGVPPDHNAQYMREMRTRLNLTEPQLSQLTQIMSDTRRRVHEARKAIEEDHAQKVLAMLNDDQKAEYAVMRQEHEKRRQQAHKDH